MVSGRSSQAIKAIRRHLRSKAEAIALEGPRLVVEALRSGIELDWLLVTPELAATVEGRKLLELAGRAARPVSPTGATADAIESLAEASSPQGALAVGRLPRSPAPAAAPLPASGLYLYLDGVQDPGNVGAIARVAEGTAARGLFLGPGCASPNHPRALRASAGSLLRLPVWVQAGVDATERSFERRLRWVGLDAHRGVKLWEVQPPSPAVLALGAEGAGLSPEVESRLDERWRIPLSGDVESLNVSTAAAVVLFELARRRAGA